MYSVHTAYLAAPAVQRYTLQMYRPMPVIKESTTSLTNKNANALLRCAATYNRHKPRRDIDQFDRFLLRKFNVIVNSKNALECFINLCTIVKRPFYF